MAGSVEGFVPFIHVQDVLASTAFYEHFDFEVHNSYDVDGRRVWCWLERNQARLMLADAGLEPGEIHDGRPGPDREFEINDPDGHCLMVTDAEAMWPGS